MKHNTSNRRSRNRGGKRQGGGRNNFESNGPDVKVRGTAQQVLDKYLVLARDASSAGDRIKSESYFQFAEHYYRIVSADTANSANSAASRRESNQAPDPVVAESNTLQSTGSSQTGVEANELDGDQVVNPIGESSLKPENYEGKIDESVLPVAAPKTQSPRRRRKSEVESESLSAAEVEPEVA
tara:strand:- start:277 stop:825 length:549 start_codon:yes stop_codon:yes gene_type:complete